MFTFNCNFKQHDLSMYHYQPNNAFWKKQNEYTVTMAYFNCIGIAKYFNSWMISKEPNIIMENMLGV